MLLTYIYIYIYYTYIYLDIVPDVPDTFGESTNNIGPPSGSPKTMIIVCILALSHLLLYSKCQNYSSHCGEQDLVYTFEISQLCPEGLFCDPVLVYLTCELLWSIVACVYAYAGQCWGRYF